jgi:glycosyltransferase involved in cell wall biosynthesis
MERAPRVTVVLPNYNHGRFLARRIESVLNQTYADFEAVVIDDASTDNSRDVIERYTRDARVRTVWNERNSGSPFRQWNRGMRMARGEYAWIAESDDAAESALLQTLVEKLDRSPRVGLAYCQSWGIDEEGTIITHNTAWTDSLDAQRWRQDFVNDGRDECRRFLVMKNTIPNASAAVFRRSVFDRAGGADESFQSCGDWMTWVRMLLLSDVAYSAETLNYFRVHPDSVTRRRGEGVNQLLEWFRVRAAVARHVELDPGMRRRVCEDMADMWRGTAGGTRYEFRWRDHARVLAAAGRLGPAVASRLLAGALRRSRWGHALAAGRRAVRRAGTREP